MPGERLPIILNDHFLETKPGLSAYKDDPSKAGKSLEPLMQHAYKFVPERLRASTPVQFKATAGLRLLPDEVSLALLESVRDYLAAQPWRFAREWCDILDGVDEAVFAWVTANYLLGTLDDKPDDTVGIMDLGGGSTQITYAHTDPAGALDAFVLKDVPVGGVTWRLYAWSHLGYGLKEAYKRFSQLLAESAADIKVIRSGCFPRGAELALPGGVRALGSGSFHDCAASIKALLFHDESPFFGVAPVSIKQQFWAFSYFYDRSTEMGFDPSNGNLTLAVFAKAGKEACALPHGEGVLADNDRMCFDLAYCLTLLRDGYGFSDAYSHLSLTTDKKIRGKELGWALGAQLAIIPAPPSRVEL